jgi:hypothetical protein
VARVGFISVGFNYLPGGALLQAPILRRQVDAAARKLRFRQPIFLYAFMDGLFPLCVQMTHDHFMLHICMDQSVMVVPQYDRYVGAADKTLTNPMSCYHKFKARYGDKDVPILQSGNVR